MAKSRPRKSVTKRPGQKRSPSPAPPLSPRDARAAAAAAICRVFSARQQQANDGLRDWIQQTWPTTLEQMDSEWRDETGQAMPRGVDEVTIAARMAGFSADYAETGDYTLNQVHRQQIAAKKLAENEAANRKLTAAQIAQEIVEINPGVAVDQWQQIFKNLEPNEQLVLVALREINAVSRDRKIVARELQDMTGLSFNQLRTVKENRLPRHGVNLVETQPGCRGGSWLTPEGELVAEKIDAKILPPKKSFYGEKRNMRNLRA